MHESGEKRIRVFGEVLFDHLPTGEQVLGGAPFNVAWHLTAFGLAPALITRIGDDDGGTRILEAMRRWGMDTAEVQVDRRLPTGRVEVTIENGEPGYDIRADCAYDAIEPPRSAGCDLLYHGSLAARSATSLATLRGLRGARPGKVFVDVNLRRPWWSPALVRELIQGADWVKLNREELGLLAGNAGGDSPVEEKSAVEAAADGLLARYRLEALLLTCGESGANIALASGEHFAVRPSKSEAVVDTIGAGDAFAAVAILGLLEGWPPPELLARAQQFASVIVANRGATLRERSVYETLRRRWAAAD